MMKPFLSIICFLGLLPINMCTAKEFVTGELISMQAITSLNEKVSQEYQGAQVNQIGKLSDVVIPEGKHWTPQVREIKINSQSARAFVSVQLLLDGKIWKTKTVCFAISHIKEMPVYSHDYARYTQENAVQIKYQMKDVMRTSDSILTDRNLINGKQLSKNVKVGDLVVLTDFEAVPDVLIGQLVKVESTSGSAKISTTGTAISNGNIGQVVKVLVNGSTGNIQARVISHQVVSIEN